MSNLRRIVIPIVTDASGAFTKTLHLTRCEITDILYKPLGSDIAQVDTITVDATGGTFTVTRDSITSAAIDANETGANVQTALRAAGDSFAGVVVARTGSVNAYVYTVTYSGGTVKYAPGEWFATTASGASLTGGAGTATVLAVTTALRSTGDVNLKDAVGNTVWATLTIGAANIARRMVSVGWDPTSINNEAFGPVYVDGILLAGGTYTLNVANANDYTQLANGVVTLITRS